MQPPLKMRMVDAHCHVETMEDPGTILSEARDKQMAVITSPESPGEFTRALALRAAHPHLFITAGFSASGRGTVDVNEYVSMAERNRNNIAGIGEVGLDYYWVRKPAAREQLMRTFSRFIELAIELDLPLVVHCREAYDDIFGVLERHGPKKVMLHCFSGTEKDLTRALRNGYCISFATNVCYKSPFLQHALHTPIEMMVLETDAPFLHPSGERKTNVPWNIEESAKVIAAAKGIAPDEVLAATAENAMRFFHLV